MPKGLNSACQRRHIFNGLKPRRCFIGPSLLTLANEIALRLGDYHPPQRIVFVIKSSVSARQAKAGKAAMCSAHSHM
jgi:hypothetical protein